MANNIINNAIFLFLLFGSMLGQVVVFTYKIKFNMPKVAIGVFILYFFIVYRGALIEYLKKHKKAVALLFLFSLWATVSFILTPYKHYAQAFPYFLRYIILPFLVIALGVYIKHTKITGWIIFYYFLVFLGIGGFLELFWFKKLYPIFRLCQPKWAYGDPFIQSFLSQHNIFGNVMVFLFYLGLFLFLKKKLTIIPFSIGTIVSIGGIFLSTSRGAMFSFVVSLIVALFFIGTKKHKLIILLSLVVFLFVFLFTISHYPKLLPRIRVIYPGIVYLKKGDFATLYKKGLLFKVRYNFSGREGIWEKGLELFKKSPVSGIGTGSYRFVSGKGKIHHLHDIFLDIMVEQGIVGLIIFTILILYLFSLSFKRKNEGFEFYLLIIVIASQVFDYFFDHSYFYFILMSFLFSNIITNDSD